MCKIKDFSAIKNEGSTDICGNLYKRKTNMVRPHPYVESKKQKPHRNRE